MHEDENDDEVCFDAMFRLKFGDEIRGKEKRGRWMRN